ncbi:helix-turn-helix domain-containing protein [Flavobacterium sp. W22_SRS_FP1]|uniref:helix-turn-helix domain-containing protein n=1 Tax=Flavobacterium sp. W22_SRS_FP1 TaxID=3240276 RepID=UPI003F90CCCD
MNFNLIGKNIWFNDNKVRIVNKHTRLINKAALFLFIIATINILRALLSLYFQIFNEDPFIDIDYIWVPALVWTILFIKILISPELLYGYNLFIDIIKKDNIEQLELANVWIINSKKEIYNPQNIKLKKQIDKNIIKYIAEIEKRASDIGSFKDCKYSLSELAQDLRIPNSHLNYVFKYHCKISFLDYKKNIRIRHSIELLQSNYLRTSTLESLAREVGFASYNPFFCSFKDITGLSPKEYVVQLKA